MDAWDIAFASSQWSGADRRVGARPPSGQRSEQERLAYDAAVGWLRSEVKAEAAGSLVWLGGGLFDVAAGWRRLDMEQDRAWASFGDFDTAVLAPARDLVALIDSDGTKALLLEPGGRVVREVDRSWYCASAYRYPLALFTLPDGRTGLAHCPLRYNQIEIEVAATGEPLTRRPDLEAADVFHSRLQVSGDGTRLLTAGWIWHPLAVAASYSVAAALADPSALDRDDDPFARSIDAEVAGACFSGDDIVVATTTECLGNHDGLGPLMLARWSTRDQCYAWQRPAPADLGDLVSFHGYVLALNGYPRVFESRTGDLAAEWPDLDIPTTQGPLFGANGVNAGSTMVAVDPDLPRFAVVQPGRVVILTQTSA